VPVATAAAFHLSDGSLSDATPATGSVLLARGTTITLDRLLDRSLSLTGDPTLDAYVNPQTSTGNADVSVRLLDCGTPCTVVATGTLNLAHGSDFQPVSSTLTAAGPGLTIPAGDTLRLELTLDATPNVKSDVLVGLGSGRDSTLTIPALVTPSSTLRRTPVAVLAALLVVVLPAVRRRR
jgi:hypothetical protein